MGTDEARSQAIAEMAASRGGHKARVLVREEPTRAGPGGTVLRGGDVVVAVDSFGRAVTGDGLGDLEADVMYRDVETGEQLALAGGRLVRV